jgi:tetratricopeptide (TPR) repeat protein
MEPRVDPDPTPTGPKQRLRSTAVLFLLVVVVALGARLTFFSELVGSIHDEFQLLQVLDTHTFDAWAKDIAGGDWLGRTPPHPYHEWWQGPIAPPEQWIEWFGGEQVYHQGPLYPYVCAAIYGISGQERRAVWIVQLLLGALHAGLVFLLARRFVGPWASLTAGLAMALYAPLILYEGALLRDALLAHLSTLALYAAVVALQRRSWQWAAAAGAVCGVGIVTKPALLLFTVGLAILFAVRQRRAVLPFLAAALLFVAPFAIRNLAVGVAPFKLTTRGPVAFVTGNAADAPGVGWKPPPSTAEILYRSNYRLLPTIFETLGTHRERPLGFVRLQWKKLRAYVGGDEIGNNLQFYHARRGSRVLRTPPGVPHTLIAAVGLAGLVVAWRRRAELAPAYVLFVTHTAATLGFFYVSRFRQPVVPVLILFGAVLLSAVGTALRERRLARAVLPLTLAAVLLVPAWPRTTDRERFDPEIFASEVVLATRRNDIEGALATADASAAIFDDHTATQVLAGKLRMVAGQPARAEEAFARARRLDPQDGVACLGVGQARIGQGRMAEAIPELQRCLELPGAESDADLAYVLGLAYAQTGDAGRAREALARALRLRPDDRRAAVAREVMGE